MAIYNSKWTGIEIDERLEQVGKFSNTNLLDNWYFGNPVNQRGQTEYTGSTYASKIGLDRWWCRLGSTNTGAVKVESDGLVMDITEPQFFAVVQNIEHSEKLYGRTCTASVLVTENTINDARGGARLTVSYQNIGTANVGTTVGYVNYDGVGLYSTTFTFPETLAENQCFKFVMSAVNSSNGSTATSGHVKALAAKLEFGYHQTLAHQENGVWVLNEIPNYADELAKCQRYYRHRGAKTTYGGFGIGNCVSTTIASINVPRNGAMRTQPSVSVSGSFKLQADNSRIIVPEKIEIDQVSDFFVRLKITASGLTAGQTVVLQANNDANAYISESADL